MKPVLPGPRQGALVLELVVTELETDQAPVIRVPHDEIEILVREPAAESFPLYLPCIANLGENAEPPSCLTFCLSVSTYQ
jgi:hypothetical protein